MRKTTTIILSAIILSSCAVVNENLEPVREHRRQERQSAMETKALNDSLAASGEIAAGFSRRLVRKVWGPPDHRNSVWIEKTLRVVHQWVYPERNTYAYFLGDRLTDIRPIYQEKKKETARKRNSYNKTI